MDVIKAGQAREDTTFLDVGCNSKLCCSVHFHLRLDNSLVGTDVRKLVFDGYPAKNIYACDLHTQFLELGYKLYRDKDTCEITFFPADILSFSPTPLANSSGGPMSPLETFRDRVTHLYCGLFFHLFDEQGQEDIAKRLAALLDRRPGSLIFGTHVGSAAAGPTLTPASR